MNDKQKIKFFWKIINHLNNKFCNGKIKINKIFFYEESEYLDPRRRPFVGYYSHDKKIIGLRTGCSLTRYIAILCHEFGHAYQYQIWKFSSERRRVHDKKSRDMMDFLSRETDNIITVKLKGPLQTEIKNEKVI